MIHQLSQLLTTGLINSFGNWGVFIGMALESACIPLPSEVIMVFAGFLVNRGVLSFWGVILAGILGNLAGSVIVFWIGATKGRPFVQNYGKYVLFNNKHLDKADHWFAKYGELAVFLGRMLPVVRTFISLPAGITRMNFLKFLLYTLVGSTPWNIALTYLGLKLGQNWQVVGRFFHPISYVVLAVIILAIAWHIYKSLRRSFVG